jgi:hypothetical protein
MPADGVGADGPGADGPGADGGLEAALDELFGSDPSEFVATRKRLARELRAAGDGAAARKLEATRRPTRSAWALNALARRRPDLIGALFERSEELRIAQNRALAGERGSQRDATRVQRQALADATEAAVAILEGTGKGSRAEILSTLQGAAADEDFGAVLRAGRLERAEVAATGFPDGLTGGGVVPPDVLAERRSRRTERRDPSKRAIGADAGRPGVPVGDQSDRQAKAGAREADRQRERERQQADARRRAAAELDRADESLRSATDDAAAASAHVVEVEVQVATLRAEVEAARLELRMAKERAAATAREVTRRAREVVRRRAALGPP